MSIITISRGSYSRGKEIAQKVAERLDYECISRDIILEASEEFNIPEVKLVRAIHDSPSIFDRLSLKKDKYVAFVQSALTQHFRKDNIVYHGLAGHFFVTGISHVLKVRIIADYEDRAKCEMEREGISKSKALQILKKDDSERHKWSKQLYGIDTSDPNLYDLVIRVHKITVDDATNIICNTVRMKDFQTTDESRQMMDDMALMSQVKANLLGVSLDLNVSALNGVVSVDIKAPLAHEQALVEKVRGAIEGIEDIKDIKINVMPSSP